MSSRVSGTVIVAMGGLFLTIGAAGASASGSGKDLFTSKACVSCHGQDGREAIQAIPNLAGQNGAYLFKQMRDIADGKRVSGPDADGRLRTVAMRDVMGSVGTDEMKAIAEWLGSMPAPSAVRGDAGKAAQGAELYVDFGCVGCHGADGLKPLADYPVIGGQKKDYITLQIKDIRDDVRTNGRARLMIGFARELTDAQVDLLAEYLSRIDRTASGR